MDAASTVLQLLEEGFERKTWHGPNLWQSLKGVTAKQAAWRPGPDRHNIWEQALHAAYWKYAVRRRLQGGRRGAFALKGSNFFRRPQPNDLTESPCRPHKTSLGQKHQALHSTLNKKR